MKTEVTIVPKDKCPLDILADLGERTKSAWIFLHENAVEKLVNIANQKQEFASSLKLIFEATKESLETEVVISTVSLGTFYYPISTIKADDIAFEYYASEPAEIFLLKMED